MTTARGRYSVRGLGRHRPTAIRQAAKVQYFMAILNILNPHLISHSLPRMNVTALLIIRYFCIILLPLASASPSHPLKIEYSTRNSLSSWLCEQLLTFFLVNHCE